MTKKPGIAPYNLLKGQVMELGYVTETGERVRVKSLPANGLDRMQMNNIMNNIRQDMCELKDPFSKPPKSKETVYVGTGPAKGERKYGLERTPDASDKKKQIKETAGGLNPSPKQDKKYNEWLKKQVENRKKNQTKPLKEEILEDIAELSEEEFDNFLDTLNDEEVAELEEMLDEGYLGKKMASFGARVKARAGAIGSAVANAPAAMVAGPKRALANKLAADADKYDAGKASREAKRSGTRAKADSLNRRAKHALATGKVATTVRIAKAVSDPEVARAAGKAAAAAAKARVQNNMNKKKAVTESYGYDSTSPQSYEAEPHIPKHQYENTHEYVRRAADALIAHHASHPTKPLKLNRRSTMAYVAATHLHPGKDFRHPDNAGAAQDVLRASLGKEAIDHKGNPKFEPHYASVLISKYHKAMREKNYE